MAESDLFDCTARVSIPPRPSFGELLGCPGRKISRVPEVSDGFPGDPLRWKLEAPANPHVVFSGWFRASGCFQSQGHGIARNMITTGWLVSTQRFEHASANVHADDDIFGA